MLIGGFEPPHANIPGPKPGSLDHSDKSTCWIYYFCLLSDLNRRGAFAHQVLNPTRSARLREIGNMLFLYNSDGWFRSTDLLVMSQTRFHCATSLSEHFNVIFRTYYLINVIFDYSYAHIPVQILASFLPTTDGCVNVGSLVAFFFEYVGQHSYADTRTSYLLDL